MTPHSALAPIFKPVLDKRVRDRTVIVQTTATPNEDAIPLRSWTAVLGGSIGAFMAVLNIQTTSASLEHIQGSLSANLDEGSWIATSYLTAEIVAIPLSAWLCRLFSLRRYTLVNTGSS